MYGSATSRVTAKAGLDRDHRSLAQLIIQGHHVKTERDSKKERGDSEMKDSLSLKDEGRTEVWKIRMTRPARW